MRFWIDIENPPQVQYLVPLAAAFEETGAEVTITARDLGMTLPLLRDRGVAFNEVGEAFGAKKRQKAVGLVKRTRALLKLLRSQPTPRALVSSSRPSAIAARRLGIPSFIVCDYEHAELRLYRLAGSYLLHPDVIAAQVFESKGFSRGRLVPFPGIKEDITFAGIDVDAVPAHRFDADDSLVRVLFRPPAEESHYYTSQSGALAFELLGHLARRDDAVVVFSPRYPWQREYLDRLEWKNQPLYLDSPVPFLSLLKSVDVVISSGGSMLREAAWLGVPAYSILQSELGSVDRHLESLGRLELITRPSEFSRIQLTKLTHRAARMQVPGVPEQLVRAIRDRSAASP